MKTIRDLKTGTVFIAGFAAIILLMLAISGVAWQQTNQLAHQNDQLYNHPLQVRGALGMFETCINAIHRDMRGLVISENEQEVETMISNMELNQAEAFRQLEILEARYLGPVGDIQSLREEFVKWNSIRQETIRLMRQGKLDEAADRTKPTGVGGSQAQRLFAQTIVVDNFAKKKADQFHSDALKLKIQLNRRLLLLSIAAFLLSVVLAYALVQLINHPLRVITRAIDDYRSGSKSARSTYRSGNQFGKLSGSFNEMADALETDNRIASCASELSGIMLSENDAHRFCNEFLKKLLAVTNSQMGAVYLLNNDRTLFERFSCLGMNPEGCRPFSAIHPEGEFGRVLSSHSIVHISDIPADTRFSFSSVAGNFKPREIITIPILNNKQVVAIISIFSLHNFSTIHTRIIENVFDTLTARMNGLLAHEQIVEFSKKLSEQNSELDAQSKELTAMANELKEQNAELEVQKYQLGEMNQLKTNFLSNMSHELRTPLNSVIALSGVLNRRLADKIDEEEYSYLGVIERNGKHLLNLINNILDLSRIEAGKVEVETNRFSVTALLNDVVTMIKPQASVKGIGLVVKGKNTDVMIESDYTKCFHIFQNIIGNAVKFTEKGSVDVEVFTRKNKVEVVVADTGIGIHPADLPRIFDEFRQADGSNSRKFEGTGLGLSIAKKYAGLIHCSIHVSSEPGKGSVFTVALPLKADYTASADSKLEAEVNQPMSLSNERTRGEGKRILVVEDTEAMIVQIRDVLEEEGYEVDIARNGLEAIDQLAKNVPDAMIIDIMMPGMDGIELLNAIRSKEPTDRLPVLVLTAKILSEEEKRNIKNNHIHQLIQKGTITQDSLLEAVATMMVKNDD
ncbi:MAG: ATP-binding protein [Paludibacter sp.]|jgi:signal transduction histidine kinase/CheY-like chemotaxis protein/HAMP domain-containing protein|nr:ATP-binding protein [Paludibacter sp.]